VSVSKTAIIASAPATWARPNATKNFVPKRRVRPTASFEARIMPTAIGSILTPAWSAL
jgi:hypothetical protein